MEDGTVPTRGSDAGHDGGAAAAEDTLETYAEGEAKRAALAERQQEGASTHTDGL